jgi:hypothetical protein
VSDSAKHLLAVLGRGQHGLTRRGLGKQGAEVVGRGPKRRLCALDRDERLGQAVPDGLE